MRYFKLGCNWGRGAKDFYPLLKKHNIVIGYAKTAEYEAGDIIAICKGFCVKAIALVLEKARPATDFSDFKNPFEDYEVDYHSDVLVSKADIKELPPQHSFEYQTQQGIIKIHKQEIIDKINKFKKELIDMKCSDLNKITNIAKTKKNIILQGAPGTGKTYSTAQLALSVIGGYDEILFDHEKVMEEYHKLRQKGQIEFVTFHMSMDYEDFVEGIKPSSEGSTITYSIEDGIFKSICNKATKGSNEKAENHVLIIDEINRGNISKIFGELITLIESDKRTDSTDKRTARLPYSKKEFGVPGNLYIIGTMNTTDRSVGSIDYALRRRFAFVTIESSEDIIRNYYNKTGNTLLGSKACTLFNDVKDFLTENKTNETDIKDLMVGHSFFMAQSEDELNLKWEYEVIPLLNEYYQDGIIKKRWSISNQ